MHMWNDEWFEKNGNDLHNAIDYCMKTWIKYGRIGTHGKEKYGTFRDYVYFYNGYWAIHELVKPGYIYYRWPKWLMKLDIKLGRVVQFLRLYVPIQWYQAQVYNYTIQTVCKKYPNIIDELVSDLDGYELVKPGIFGKVDGIVIHKKYWKSFDEEEDEKF